MGNHFYKHGEIKHAYNVQQPLTRVFEIVSISVIQSQLCDLALCHFHFDVKMLKSSH